MAVASTKFNLDKTLDLRAKLVFDRVFRFLNSFNIVAALVAGLSLAVLSFAEFHPTESPSARAAEGLLCSSSLTAVVAVMVATMLLFFFEGLQSPTRRDLALAWVPLVFLDLSIVEFLVGLVLWYSQKNGQSRTAVMAAQLGILLTSAVAITIWMWQKMSIPGGLGTDESAVQPSGTSQ